MDQLPKPDGSWAQVLSWGFASLLSGWVLFQNFFKGRRWIREDNATIQRMGEEMERMREHFRGQEMFYEVQLDAAREKQTRAEERADRYSELLNEKIEGFSDVKADNAQIKAQLGFLKEQNDTLIKQNRELVAQNRELTLRIEQLLSSPR